MRQILGRGAQGASGKRQVQGVRRVARQRFALPQQIGRPALERPRQSTGEQGSQTARHARVQMRITRRIATA